MSIPIIVPIILSKCRFAFWYIITLKMKAFKAIVKSKTFSFSPDSSYAHFSKQQEMGFATALNLFCCLCLSFSYVFSYSFWQTHIMRMVSYKRLNPEDVQFSSAVLSEEPCPVQEEVPVSSYVYIYCLLCLKKNRLLKSLLHKCLAVASGWQCFGIL